MIVNVISTSVKQPIPGLGVSNTIRGAVASWAKTLGIRIGQVLESRSTTCYQDLPAPRGWHRSSPIKRTNKDVETQATIEQQMMATIPAGRFADPSEVAAAVAFLGISGRQLREWHQPSRSTEAVHRAFDEDPQPNRWPTRARRVDNQWLSFGKSSHWGSRMRSVPNSTDDGH